MKGRPAYKLTRGKVLYGIATGRSYAELAAECHCAEDSVRRVIRDLRKELGARSNEHLICLAILQGYLITDISYGALYIGKPLPGEEPVDRPPPGKRWSKVEFTHRIEKAMELMKQPGATIYGSAKRAGVSAWAIKLRLKANGEDRV